MYTQKNERANINSSRFFVPRKEFLGDTVALSDSDAKHAADVLRMRPCDHITVFDGDGSDYDCELVHVGKDGVLARVGSRSPSVGEPDIRVTLWQSIPRADKFDYIIQKCVEAGVTYIVPVTSERTQIRLKHRTENGAKPPDFSCQPSEFAGAPDPLYKRLTRWRRISYEAAKQSGRGIVPQVSAPVDFLDAVNCCAARINDSSASRAALIPYENEKETSLKSALCAFKKGFVTKSAELHVFIGPEGGYDPREIDTAARLGIVPVTLGTRIFRSETAGLAVICAVMYEFEK